MVAGRPGSILAGVEYCKACGWVLLAMGETVPYAFKLADPCRVVPELKVA